jgi:hypothetical protein
MNNGVFDFCDRLIRAYSAFSRSFSRIAAPGIRDEVERQYDEGRYWQNHPLFDFEAQEHTAQMDAGRRQLLEQRFRYTDKDRKDWAADSTHEAELAHALPDQVAQDYQAILQQELAQLPDELKNTEVERLVRQRVGQ